MTTTETNGVVPDVYDGGDFCHLHTHTEYSTLDGINRVDKLPEYVKSLGMKAISCTDHGNTSAHYKFYKACKKASIKPILGLEAYYCVGDRSAKEVDIDGEKYYHLVLLATGLVGQQNLYKLTSRSFSEGMYFKPRIDDALLAEYNEGLLATSACLGSRVSQLILKNRSKEAENLLLHHAEIFKDRFFLELQCHEGREQQLVNQELIRVSSARGLPLIVTADCHYMQEEDKLQHEQALCMQTQDVMSSPNRFTFGDIDVHVASPSRMRERLIRCNIPLEAMTNTIHIADMIKSSEYFGDIYNKYPVFPDVPEGLTSFETLNNLSKSMLSEKMGGDMPQKYKDRINEELKVIKVMGFCDYILIVYDFIEMARKHDVLAGPGRGSAAGSLVAYALGITQIDPIKYGLLFSRFLNQGRSSTPLILSTEMREMIKE